MPNSCTSIYRSGSLQPISSLKCTSHQSKTKTKTTTETRELNIGNLFSAPHTHTHKTTRIIFDTWQRNSQFSALSFFQFSFHIDLSLTAPHYLKLSIQLSISSILSSLLPDKNCTIQPIMKFSGIDVNFHVTPTLAVCSPFVKLIKYIYFYPKKRNTSPVCLLIQVDNRWAVIIECGCKSKLSAMPLCHCVLVGIYHWLFQCFNIETCQTQFFCVQRFVCLWKFTTTDTTH